MLVPLIKTNFQIVMLKRGLSPFGFCAEKSVAKMLEAMVKERLP